MVKYTPWKSLCTAQPTVMVGVVMWSHALLLELTSLALYVNVNVVPDDVPLDVVTVNDAV
jgi:hypothetical protein